MLKFKSCSIFYYKKLYFANNGCYNFVGIRKRYEKIGVKNDEKQQRYNKTLFN